MYRTALLICLSALMIVMASGCGSIIQTVAFNSAESGEGRSVVYAVYGMSFLNPYDSRQIVTGETVKAAADGSNIYLESASGRLTSVFSAKTIESATFGISPPNAVLHRAMNPRPVNGGTKIVYASNRSVIESEHPHTYSLYITNPNGSNDQLLLDGKKFGSLSIVDTLGSLVYAAGQDDSLVVIDTDTSETKKYRIGGRVDAVSSEGTHVLYRIVKEGYVHPELWIFNLTDSSSKRIGEQPAHYFIGK